METYPASEAGVPGALDCIFVKQPIFLIIEMRDLYQNKVYIDDQEAWQDLMTINFGRPDLCSDICNNGGTDEACQ